MKLEKYYDDTHDHIILLNAKCRANVCVPNYTGGSAHVIVFTDRDDDRDYTWVVNNNVYNFKPEHTYAIKGLYDKKEKKLKYVCPLKKAEYDTAITHAKCSSEIDDDLARDMKLKALDAKINDLIDKKNAQSVHKDDKIDALDVLLGKADYKNK